MRRPDEQGLYRPASEDEIRELVRLARRRGLPVRVRGTGHSVDEAIFTTERIRGRPADAVDMVLDRYEGISFDEERRQVTVQAGCRLGANPRDRTGRATAETGLCRRLDERGWALPITAGVTRQTVGGLLMTGSAGGSRRHALTDQVVALRLIDGEGEVHELSRERDADLFDAAVVSLGLLGIVSTVTLQCVERFDVEGEEAIVAVDAAPFALTADGAAGVEGFLRAAEYGRIFWWPQRWVDKLTIWSARSGTGSAAAASRPYRVLPEVLGSSTPVQAVAGTVIGAACRRRRWGRATAAVYNAFMPAGEPQRFRDAWWRAIPMDDELDERFFPSTYCELWLPADATGEALRRLRDHYRAGGFAATGGYTVEVYAAKASPLWLSPAYERDSTRLNFCWHERAKGDPRRDYFPQFLELFDDLGFRLHWGKHLFADPARSAAHLAAAYPRLGDFLALRERLDPHGVFLTDYWRDHLGIRTSVPRRSPASSSAARSVGPPGRRWPLLFKLRPSDPGFADRARHAIDIRTTVNAPPEAIFDAIVNLAGAREWLPDFVRARWVEGPDAEGRQVVDETFRFMSQRVRTLHAERGRRWIASIEACTLPLGREMLEDLRLAPRPDGGTDLRWLYCYEPPIAMRPFRRILHGEFEKMLRHSLEQLESHLTAGPE